MPDAQRIIIRIKKGTDGRTALSCTRSDGTTAWQRQEGGQAAFFPRHDLEAVISEMIVGLFDLERIPGNRVTADDLNRRLAEHCADNDLPQQRSFTEDDLALVGQKRDDLFARWEAVRPGDPLEIPFRRSIC